MRDLVWPNITKNLPHHYTNDQTASVVWILLLGGPLTHQGEEPGWKIKHFQCKTSKQH